MSRWLPAAYWVVGTACLLIGLFILDDDSSKLFAVLFGMILCLRGDVLQLRHQLDEWRRI